MFYPLSVHFGGRLGADKNKMAIRPRQWFINIRLRTIYHQKMGARPHLRNMYLIVPQGCTKPCLRLRRNHEGPSGPMGPFRARGGLSGPKGPFRASRVGPGPWIPTVIRFGPTAIPD